MTRLVSRLALRLVFPAPLCIGHTTVRILYSIACVFVSIHCSCLAVALYSVLGFVWLVCLRADVISGEFMTMGKGAAAGGTCGGVAKEQDLMPFQPIRCVSMRV